MAHILIVEDNRDLVFGLRTNLSLEGFQVTAVHEGDQVLAAAERVLPDLILLDLMLPGMSGFEVLEGFRARDPLTPVVVLSARDAKADRVWAFRLGADDYVTKPFSLLELIERIRARLRIAELLTSKTHAFEFVVHVQRGQVQIGSEFVHFAPKELALLQALLESAGTALSKETLLARVWHSPPIDTRTVEFHISRVRRRLAPHGLDKRIVTVPRVGFMWDESAAAGSR